MGKVTPTGVLYSVYAFFFISAFFASSESAITQYISSLAGMTIMLGMLLMGRARFSVVSWQYLLLIFLIGYSFILLLKARNFYSVMLNAEIMIFILFFSIYTIPKSSYISFVNKTYLIYLTVSVVLWLLALSSPGATSGTYNEEFYVSFGTFGYFILGGMEGSPSFIDSYSALVLVLNVFVNKGRDRKLLILASTLAILAAFRLTPMAALIAVFALYPLYRNSRFAASAILIAIPVLFLWLLSALINSDYVTIDGQRIDIWVLAYGLTHARSMIWKQQVEILLANYDLMDYLFGRYSTELFEVQAIQLWGQMKDEFHANPHNSLLLMFFRSPFLFVMFFAIFLIAQFRKFDKSTFPVLLLIFLSAFTNASLISLGNPVYLMTIVYLLTFSEPQQKNPGADNAGVQRSF